jgi:hypothetical protein
MKIRIEFIEHKKRGTKETAMVIAIIGLALTVIFLLLKERLYF